MPQAPTVPGLVPTQAPSGAIPTVDLPVPTDAFGGAIGTALEHMGVDVSQAGGQIWDRAMQLQDIQNRTEVDNADAEFIKQTALKHAEFNAKLGENAGPAALAAHIQDIESIRSGIRDNLSNPMSQRMFNSTSLSTMGRYISNASNHSANEVKSAYHQGLALRQSAIGNEIADDPDDPGLRSKFRAITTIQAQEKGLSGRDIPEYVSNAESAVNLETISRVADKNPLTAKQMIDDYHAKGALMGEQYDKALEIYKAKAYQIIPDQIATQVNADLKNQTDPERTGATEQERIQLARDHAMQQYKDLPLMPSEAERATRASYSAHLTAVRDLNYRNKAQMGDILEGNYSPDGKMPTSLADVAAVPGGQKTYDALTEPQKKQVKLALYNNAQGGKFGPTPEGQTQYRQILGQLGSDDPTEVTKGMDVYTPSLQMPQAWRDKIRQEQDKRFKGTPNDYRIGQAMELLRPSLGDLSKDDIAQFRGEFQLIAEDYFKNNNEKMMPNDEIRKVGAQLLQKQDSGHWWIPDSPMFQETIPSSVLEQVKKDAAAKGQAVTDQQAQAEYIRQRYNALQKAAKQKQQQSQ